LFEKRDKKSCDTVPLKFPGNGQSGTNGIPLCFIHTIKEEICVFTFSPFNTGQHYLLFSICQIFIRLSE
jgi:hypothetical protein